MRATVSARARPVGNQRWGESVFFFGVHSTVVPLRAAVALCCGLWLVPGTQAGELREWTSRDGRFRVSAELLAVDTPNVRLRTAAGKSLTVAIEKLSPEDQEYLRQQVAAAGDPQWQELLEEKGIRTSSGGPMLRDESRLGKGLRDAKDLLKAWRGAARELDAVAELESQTRAAIHAMTQRNVVLNAQLSAPGSRDVQRQNQLVAAVNANQSRMQLLQARLSEIQQGLTAARGNVTAAREAYLQRVLELRTLANQIESQYAVLAADAEVSQALAALAAASASQPLALRPSRGFQASLRRLKALENHVLSEEIPLRVDRGTLYVNVVIGGTKSREMVLDSGASLMTIPENIAGELNIDVSSEARTINLQVADGRSIKGRLVNLPSVRVGQFTAENVACAVLGPEAANAPPLLGMSFLDHFKIEVDPAGSKLKMSKIVAGEADR